MKQTRKGYGKGLGMGYKNLVPLDPYIHSLSAKGVKTVIVDFSSAKSIKDAGKKRMRLIYNQGMKEVKTEQIGLDKFKMTFNAKGHYCDQCGTPLSQEDYTGKGEWSYSCPKCKFKYIHGVTELNAKKRKGWQKVIPKTAKKDVVGYNPKEHEFYFYTTTDAKGIKYKGWVQDTSRNPYRGFRFEKGNYAVGSHKMRGEHNIFVQKLSGGFPTSNVNFKYVRSKEQAIKLAKRVMDDVDKGNAPF